MDDELLGQSRVDEPHEEIRRIGLRHRTAERIEQAVSDEVGIFGREDDGEQLLLEAECRHAERDGHEQTFHDGCPQHVEVVPKRLSVRIRRHRLLSLLRIVLGLFLDIVHSLLERTDAFAQSFHQFGNLLAAEEQQHDQCDQQHFLHAQTADK